MRGGESVRGEEGERESERGIERGIERGGSVRLRRSEREGE